MVRVGLEDGLLAVARFDVFVFFGSSSFTVLINSCRKVVTVLVEHFDGC